MSTELAHDPSTADDTTRRRPDVDFIEQHWIPALESEQFRQTRFCLHTNDGAYCCLGVLCEISGVGGWKKWSENNFAYIVEGGSEMRVLVDIIPPRPVAEMAGLRDGTTIDLIPGRRAGDYWNAGNLLDNSEVRMSLASMNDRGCTFGEIAAVLRQICADWRAYENGGAA